MLTSTYEESVESEDQATNWFTDGSREGSQVKMPFLTSVVSGPDGESQRLSDSSHVAAWLKLTLTQVALLFQTELQ